MNNTVNKEITLQKLLTGVNTLANIVKTTSGSKGHTYLLQKPNGSPYPTKDGVTIAKAIMSDDYIEQLGIKFLQEAAQLTVDNAGDGTTSTVTITQALVNLIVEKINEGVDHRSLLMEIEEATLQVEKLLKKQSRKVNSITRAIQIASIATNNEDVGQLVGSISWEARNNGIIHLEEGEGITEIFQETGSRYNVPYEHRQLLGTNENNVTITNPLVNVLLKDVTSMNDLLPLMDEANKEGKHCVIVAPNYSKVVMQAIFNYCIVQGGKLLPLYAPGEGQQKTEYLKDIDALAQGNNINKVVADKFGYTLFTLNETTSIQKRSEVIKAQKFNEREKYLREKFDDRLASLNQKVFTINVGGISPSERSELKDRIEDGLLATRCAIVDGYVLGGGLALLNVSRQLENSPTGFSILKEAIKSPYHQILTNANKSIEYNDNVDWGFNTSTMHFEDFKKSGIIDSYKVILESVKNAVSVAKTIISLNGCIINGNNTQVV